MALTKLELVRAASAAVERLEKVLAIALHQKKRLTSSSNNDVIIASSDLPTVNTALSAQQNLVWWDMLIRRL